MPAIRRVLAILMLGAAAAGCGSAPPVPNEQYYRLIAATPSAEFAKPLDGALEVSPFAAEGVLAERPLLFTANGGRKLEQRNYAYWTDAPPQMLRDQFISYLSAAHAAPDVVQTELRIAAKYQLKGVLRRLEQSVDGQPGGIIAIDLSLIEKNTDHLIFSSSYIAEKPAAGDSIDAAVDALNAGFDEILASFAGDLQSKL
jgi:ABC-type uncharacterized transport system auxiliary subunit